MIQKLSIRKYAATIGVSHTAVSKAIHAGYIIKGYDSKDKKIIVAIADKEWGNAVKEKTACNETFSTVNKPDTSSDETVYEQDYKPTNKNISFSEARRRKEVYTAEIARIAAIKEQGLYVEKQKVYYQLAEFGQMIRRSFELIPDRIIDNILAAKSRHEAHAILTKAIYETLVKLTDHPPTF